MTKKDKILLKNKLSELIFSACYDSSLKQRLINNPRLTIESELGITMSIPIAQSIVVEDQSDESCIYLNIPNENIRSENYELADSDLEQIAGGFPWVAAIIFVAAANYVIDEFTIGWNSVDC